MPLRLNSLLANTKFHEKSLLNIICVPTYLSNLMAIKGKQCIYLLLIFFQTSGCISDNQSMPVKMKPSGTDQYLTIKKDTTLLVDSVKVGILLPPEKHAGYILMLPGWNFSRGDCCEKSSFCKKAREAGYCLIMPEMGKSVYSGGFYNETRADWKKYPSRVWVINSLIPEMQQKYGYLKRGGNNHLYGISTGARGVALLALHTKGIFKSGAALSGDYDQSVMPADNLMTGYYGAYDKFPGRWTGEDNALKNAAKIDIPLYLAHGKKDKIVPCTQTESFFATLKKLHPDGRNEIHISENAGHNYDFWDSETGNVIRFFSDE